MKTKTKLIASIMSICLVCAVFAIGVFALKTANLKIGGDVSFSATGVEAHIRNASVSGAVTPTTLAANDAEGEVINTSMTQADINSTFATWQNLKLDFNEAGDDITLLFKIANTSATDSGNYIEIDYNYTFSEAFPNVDIFPGETIDGVWQNNNYILAPKGATPSESDYTTFTLKFRLLDKEVNVKEGTSVDLTISLKHTPIQTATLEGDTLTIGDIKYTLDSETGTAMATGHTIVPERNTNIVIYPVVKADTVGATPYIVTGISLYSICATAMTSITIPNSITSIEMGAFACSTYLTSITFPKSITSIEFETIHTSGLTTINIPNVITKIGGASFVDCAGLTSIVIPSSVVEMDGWAFERCVNLSSVKFTSVGDWKVTLSETQSEIITIGTDLAANAQLLKTYTNYTWTKVVK